jgi:hypothetical protein
MKIEVTTPTLKDYEAYRQYGIDAADFLKGRVKLTCTDSLERQAESFMPKAILTAWD